VHAIVGSVLVQGQQQHSCWRKSALNELLSNQFSLAGRQELQVAAAMLLDHLDVQVSFYLRCKPVPRGP
jgi:hypothetical protein